MNDIGSSTNPEITLAMAGVSKVFPGVVALDKVDFSLRAREIVGLVGENGAGKSTLMKILIGVSQPDGGTISRDGLPISPKDPTDAIRLGIGMVFQEGTLVPNLSIMRNLFLCHEPGFQKLGFLSRREMRKAASRLMEEVKVVADVETPISDVSPA